MERHTKTVPTGRHPVIHDEVMVKEYSMNTKSTFIQKSLLALVIGLCSLTNISAQQDAQFTQFMFNKLTFNPGYAGSTIAPRLSAIHRQQWVGLEGAPVTSAINFNTTLAKQRVGMGLTFIHDQIGPTRDWTAQMAYAYKIPLDEGTLSVGLQGVLRQYRVVWNDARLTHQQDNAVMMAESSKILPNAGLGLYYEAPTFYVGVSMPHILENKLDLLEDFASTDITSLANRHIFGMAGVLIDVADDIKIKPALMVKYVKNAPIDADLNLTAILKNDFWVGLSYRFGGSKVEGIGESIDAYIQYQLTNTLRVGMAYDFTLSELRSQNSGTYEFFVTYDLRKTGRISNPRFF